MVKNIMNWVMNRGIKGGMHKVVKSTQYVPYTIQGHQMGMNRKSRSEYFNIIKNVYSDRLDNFMKKEKNNTRK